MKKGKGITADELAKTERFLVNWRELLEKDKKYAEAFFMGTWCSLNNTECAWLLTKIKYKEYLIIMDYPIWM